MKNFEYTIKDELGIHARPAGMLVKEAKKYQSKITITKRRKNSRSFQAHGRYVFRSKMRTDCTDCCRRTG